MDPLSVIASVIALCQAGDRILDLAKSLKSLKDAPKEVQDLIEDVSRLRSTLNAFLNILVQVQASRIWDYSEIEGLASLVDRVRELTTSLETTLQYTLLDPSGRVRRMRWLSNRTKIDRTRSLLRDEVSRAGVHLHELNILAQLNTAAKLDSVLMTSLILRTQQDVQQQLLEQSLETQRTIMGHFTVKSKAMEEPSSDLAASDHQASSHTAPAPHTCLTGVTSGALQSSLDRPDINTMVAAASISYCGVRCPCSCHRRNTHVHYRGLLKSVQQMLRLYARNFIDMPVMCDLDSCQRPAFPAITIATPLSWLCLDRLAVLKLSSGPSFSINICFPRLISPESDIIKYVRMNDCDRVHKILQAGRASPGDIDGSTGQTLLSIALVEASFETCSLLLKWGASPFQSGVRARGGFGVPANAAFLFTHMATVRSNHSRLKVIERTPFPVPDFDDIEFSTVHKFLHNLTPELLEHQLQTSDHLLDAADIFGHTPLMWTVMMGDTVRTELLLRYGADVNARPDLLTALDMLNFDERKTCASLLFSYGADADSRDARGDTVLHKAMRWQGMDHHVGVLVSPSNINASNNKGHSPIFVAIANANVGGVRMLLDRGAKTRCRDKKGMTPAMYAVCYNEAECLEILLDASASLDGVDVQGHTILHLAASFGGPEIWRLLLEHKAYKLDLQAIDKYSCTARDLFRKRTDKPAKLFVEEFEEWYHELERLKTLQDDIEDGLESEPDEDE